VVDSPALRVIQRLLSFDAQTQRRTSRSPARIVERHVASGADSAEPPRSVAEPFWISGSAIEGSNKEVFVPRQPRFFATPVLLAAFAIALGVAPAGAQPDRPRFELVPRVGAIASLMDLGKGRDLATLIQVNVELDIAFIAGLSVHYSPPFWPVSFRAAIDYTPLNVSAQAQPLACEIVTGEACRKVGLDTRYLVLTADVLIRAGDPEESRFYLMAGAGIKRYDFAELNCDVDDLVCSLLDDFARDQTNPTIHLGLGYDFRVGPASLEAELADYISWHDPSGGGDFTGSVQQDLFLTLGVKVAIL
jgi:hypothetical protein